MMNEYKIAKRAGLYLVMLLSIIVMLDSTSAERLIDVLEGSACSNYSQTDCEQTQCCYWSYDKCVSYPYGSTGNPYYYCYNDTFCSGENGTEIYVSVCNGASAWCGRLVETCSYGQNCWYSATCMLPPCGNGFAEMEYYESCDGTDFAGNNCRRQYDSILKKYFYGGTLTCNDNCQLNASGCNHCGDGIKDNVEVCDSGSPTRLCNVSSYTGTQTCNSACTGWNACVSTEYCGDDICNGIETNSTCFTDCVDDWSTEDLDFVLNADNSVSFTGITGTLFSDSIDLFVGKTYVLDADIQGSIIILLDDNCTSNLTFTQLNCSSEQILYAGPPNPLPTTFSLNTSQHAINGVYYKDVRLKVVFIGPSSIANISLKESASDVYYDYTPSGGSSSGCCPRDYCWDGIKCVDSGLWMNDSAYEPVWNNIFDSNWTLGHINTSAKYATTGYRCVKYNYNSSANWTISSIKYDWNFIKSGYCARSTDCFVGQDFSYGADNSRGCVPTGTLVSGESSDASGGNHYCYLGNWTTKSYIVATLLQNITGNRPYTLHCYDNKDMIYNVVPTFSLDVISACVLTKPSDEQIITGIILESDDINAVDTYLAEIAGTYETQLDGAVETFPCTSTQADLEGVSNFSKCIESDFGSTELHVYYETQYKFLIVSNEVVRGIEDFTLLGDLWIRIKQFFSNIFGRSEILRSEAYTSLNYTTSYDRIYVMRDRNVNVTAIEEYKFDELLGKPVTVFYIQHEGSSNETNPINELQIFKSVNRTVTRNRLSLVDTRYIFTPTTQELIVMTDNTTGIWSYFTAVLRTGNPGGLELSNGNINAGATSSGSSQHSVGTPSNSIPE